VADLLAGTLPNDELFFQPKPTDWQR
jgi:hypothetical protein